MEKYHIKLTGSEAEILAKIDLRDSHRNHGEGHAAYKANVTPILALLQSLSDRSAIPQQRLSYWNDPQYHQGRIKASRKGLFERNGCKGADIYTHPHFLRHLRYFLFGAELPDNVITTFEEKVGNPEWVSSSDIVPIGKFARDLTRQCHLDKTEAPEEFFKLCIDMGLSLMTAESVMRSVKQMR
ncbi:hypothetical protein [Agrobacterium vitis]|uniref:hypothetical protein n=1 Tax=Agrobacterium vitis TaxID=373 RepID=UPI0012E75E24|nr:hypothetical protein [Agrobacterium vitis]MUZ65284.1 hypothetical protein [Agrobacterium vitis]